MARNNDPRDSPDKNFMINLQHKTAQERDNLDQVIAFLENYYQQEKQRIQ